MVMIKFSIIIPTYNRREILERHLFQLLRIQYPKNKFEIVFVDNNSTDTTAILLKQFCLRQRKLDARYIFEKKQGHVFACNTGIKVARYSHVVFIDDDIAIRPDILKMYFTTYEIYKDAFIIGGKIKAVVPKTGANIIKYLDASNRWTMGECDLGNKLKILSYPNAVLSGNFSINLSLAMEATIFRTDLGFANKGVTLYGQDYELCLRSLLENKRIVYQPKIYAKNYVEVSRCNLRYLIRRYFYAGVERAIIDKGLSSYKEHVKYRVNLISLIKSYGHWFNQIEELSFAVGYFKQSLVCTFLVY